MARFIKSKGAKSLITSAGGRWLDVRYKEGIPHLTLPLDRKTPWHILWNSWHLSRFIKQNRIHIVHARSRGPAWSTWLAIRLFGCRCDFITTFHGTYGAQNPLKRFYNSVMLK